MAAGVRITPIDANSGGGGGGGGFSESRKSAVSAIQPDKSNKVFSNPQGFQKIMQGAMATGMDKAKSIKKMAGKGAGMAGISMSLSSILRMSQVFTGTIGALFQVLGGFIDAILAPFMPYIIGFIGKLGEQIPKVQAFAQGIHDFLAWIIPVLWGWIKGMFGPRFFAVVDAVKGFGKTIWGLVERFWNWISNEGEWWSGPLHPIKGFFTTVWEYIKGVWDVVVEVWEYLGGAWTTVSAWFETLWKDLTDWFPTLWTSISGWWETTGSPLFEEIKGFASGIKDEVLKLVDPIVDVIKPLLILAFKFLVWWGGVVWKVLKGMLGWLWDNIYKPLLTWIKDNLVDFLKPKLEWLAEKLNALVAWFDSPGSVFQKIQLSLLTFFKQIIDVFAKSRWFGGIGEGTSEKLGIKIAAIEDAIAQAPPTGSAPPINLSVNNSINGGTADIQTQYSQGRQGLNTMFNNVSFESQTTALNAIVDAKG